MPSPCSEKSWRRTYRASVRLGGVAFDPASSGLRVLQGRLNQHRHSISAGAAVSGCPPTVLRSSSLRTPHSVSRISLRARAPERDTSEACPSANARNGGTGERLGRAPCCIASCWSPLLLPAPRPPVDHSTRPAPARSAPHRAQGDEARKLVREAAAAADKDGSRAAGLPDASGAILHACATVLQVRVLSALHPCPAPGRFGRPRHRKLISRGACISAFAAVTLLSCWKLPQAISQTETLTHPLPSLSAPHTGSFWRTTGKRRSSSELPCSGFGPRRGLAPPLSVPPRRAGRRSGCASPLSWGTQRRERREKRPRSPV